MSAADYREKSKGAAWRCRRQLGRCVSLSARAYLHIMERWSNGWPADTLCLRLTAWPPESGRNRRWYPLFLDSKVPCFFLTLKAPFLPRSWAQRRCFPPPSSAVPTHPALAFLPRDPGRTGGLALHGLPAIATRRWCGCCWSTRQMSTRRGRCHVLVLRHWCRPPLRSDQLLQPSDPI